MPSETITAAAGVTIVAAWTAVSPLLSEVSDGWSKQDLLGPLSALALCLAALVLLARYFVSQQTIKDKLSEAHSERLERIIEGVTKAVTEASESNRAGNECIRENSRVIAEVREVIAHCKDKRGGVA
jgi:hypothetical protein